MADQQEHGNLVAEIEVGGPISFQTRMDDIISPEEEDTSLVDDEKLVLVSSQEEEEEDRQVSPQTSFTQRKEEEEENEEEENEEETSDENPYADFSEAALVGVQLSKSRPDIFEDVPKDMDWNTLVQKLDGYVAKTLEDGRNHLLNQTENYKEFIDYLMQGGDPTVLRDAINDGQYADLDIEKATDDEKEASVKAMYQDLGLGKEEIESLIETHKLAKRLDERAGKAAQHFTKKRSDRLANEAQQRKQQEQAHEQQIKQLTASMNKIIDSGSILGMKLTNAEKEQLREAYFTPTEIRTVPDGKGGTLTRRYTKYQILEAEFKNDLEKQMAFGKLLLDGFKLDKIKNQGAEERDEDIMNLLNQRDTKPTSRRNPRQNAYLYSSDGA